MGHRGAWSVYSLIKMNHFGVCIDVIYNATTIIMQFYDT